ncbi:type 1 glutamine amidotransferase domain-containing protein [Evansella tamaricis]|uniref:Type 1 glutamine amidotransferase n=1 Tax=Evansella tamaricis TaxID=2069301 RepID=A0ABS6JMB5_9BACI|nr:type 1 glutamine amidotransferase domain-containing protein [Evansella tamaricis]MBU9714827.1 type 1 glutamine amidotransferase [Evansella tamaricis]
MLLEGKKIVTVVDEEFEDLELLYPHYRLQEEGVISHIAGKEGDKIYVGKYGVPVKTEYSFEQINVEEYDGILIPGGWAPDKLRRYDEVLSMVQYMDEQKRLIGQICHAGWVLISAGILQGKKVTSTPGIKDDMENAGAIWHNEEVIIDGHLVSSRRPPDLPAYGKSLASVLGILSK